MKCCTNNLTALGALDTKHLLLWKQALTTITQNPIMLIVYEPIYLVIHLHGLHSYNCYMYSIYISFSVSYANTDKSLNVS